MAVEFEPVKLGQRHRRLDPVLIGTVMVAIALAAAVLKPWEAGAGPVEVGPAVEATADAAPADDQRYAERWFRFPSGGTEIATAQVDPSDRSIVALGVTFPPSHTPPDARVWRVDDGGLEWIDADQSEPGPRERTESTCSSTGRFAASGSRSRTGSRTCPVHRRSRSRRGS